MSKFLAAAIHVGAVALALCLSGEIRAEIITQTVTLPLSQTDFSAGNPRVTNNPMVFQQFDTAQGTRTLDSVTLSFSASITNNFSMRFVTPATIVDSVATNDPNTPGPAIILYQPNATNTLLVVKAPNDPSFLSRSVTYGFGPGQTSPQAFGYQFATNSPYYLAPATAHASNSLTTSAVSDLAIFTGAGNVALPVAATSFGSFNSTSGNGFGRITTSATATVTVQYNWHPTQPGGQTIPEPSSFVLAGLGGIGLLLARRKRRAA